MNSDWLRTEMNSHHGGDGTMVESMHHGLMNTLRCNDYTTMK